MLGLTVVRGEEKVKGDAIIKGRRGGGWGGGARERIRNADM